MKFHITPPLFSSLLVCTLCSNSAGTLAATAQVLLSSPARMADGRVEFLTQILAGSESTVLVQTSTNLAQGSWMALTNFTNTGVAVKIVDPDAAKHSRRFYRASIAAGPPVSLANPKVVWIPPGTLTLGSPTNETGRTPLERQFTVTFTRGFFMSRYELTQGEYLELMGYNPSYFSVNNGFSEDLNRPVESVNWFDTADYCARLNEVEQAAGRLPAGWKYRLPTEAEWEYACRAGAATPFHHGSDLLSGMENFDGRFEYVGGKGTVTNLSGVKLERTTAVGGYQPNAWGLYDMHGNVREICFITYAKPQSVTDPVILPSDLPVPAQAMTRGGDWNNRGVNCRSAAITTMFPTIGVFNGEANYIGFRVVLAPLP